MDSIKITVHLIGILRGKGGHGPLWPSLPSASALLVVRCSSMSSCLVEVGGGLCPYLHGSRGATSG